MRETASDCRTKLKLSSAPRNSCAGNAPFSNLCLPAGPITLSDMPIRRKNMKTAYASAALAITLAASPALAQNVKITPLGSHDGELCAADRATLFEDPTGVRLLYDA